MMQQLWCLIWHSGRVVFSISKSWNQPSILLAAGSCLLREDSSGYIFYWKVPGYQVPVRSGGETRKISEGRSCCALDRYVPFFLSLFLSLFLKPLCSMTPSLHVHLHLLPSTHPDRIPACWQQPMCVLTYQRGSIAGKDIVF